MGGKYKPKNCDTSPTEVKLAYGSFNRYNVLKKLNFSKPEYDALKNLAS